MTVTITPAQAANAARQVRDHASRACQCGYYSDFIQGIDAGMLAAIEAHMNPDPWVMQGIWNEVRFYRKRADEARLFK